MATHGRDHSDSEMEKSTVLVSTANPNHDAETNLPHYPEEASTDTEIISTLQLCLLIASLFCGTFVMALDATIIGTAVPTITAEFKSLDDIAWYGSGYLLTITAFQPTFGKLYRFVNTKWVFMVCVVIFKGTYQGIPLTLDVTD